MFSSDIAHAVSLRHAQTAGFPCKALLLVQSDSSAHGSPKSRPEVFEPFRVATFRLAATDAD
jgi:hypothetical protein